MVLLIPLAMGLALIIGVICHAVFFDKFTIEESIYHIPETTLNIFVSSEPASIRVFFSPDQIQSLKDLPDNGDCISLDPEEYDDGQLSFFYDTDNEKELIFADIHNNYQSSYYEMHKCYYRGIPNDPYNYVHIEEDGIEPAEPFFLIDVCFKDRSIVVQLPDGGKYEIKPSFLTCNEYSFWNGGYLRRYRRLLRQKGID